MIRLHVYIERKAADLRADAVLCRATDLPKSQRLLAESRELDRRAQAMRRRRSEEEDVALAQAWMRVFEAIDEQTGEAS